MGTDDGASGADRGVGDPGVGADGAALADGGAAAQVGAGPQHGVAPDADARLHVHGRRVGHRHPAPHQVLAQALLQGGLAQGQVDAVVDARGHQRIVGDQGGHRAVEPLEHVGQVDLALGVARAEAVEGGCQRGAVEHVEARVVLADGELVGGRVARLDNAVDRPVGAADDPPVGGGVLDDRGEHRGRPALGAVLGDHPGDQLGGQQRRVAARDDHRVARRVEGREADLGRVPGAELLLLHRHLHAGGQRVAHHLGAVTDHHHRVGHPAPVEGVEHPADHRAPGDRVHHLRQRRSHPGSLAGGEDDSADAHTVLVSVPGKNVESVPGWGGRNRTPDRGTKTRCLTPWLRPSSRRP